MKTSVKDLVLKYCAEIYGTAPDYPWKGSDGAVLRHANSRKWYGLVMGVERRKLLPLMREASWFSGNEDFPETGGFPDDPFHSAFPDFGDSLVSRGRAAHLQAYEEETFGLGPEDEVIDVLNLKCDPIAAQSLRARPGILPAYHMNHAQWISVLLDGTVSPEEIFPLIDMSYELTATKSARSAKGPREWIVPSNTKFFDVIGAFEAEEEIDWKQSSDVHVGDTVYLYVGAPVSAILYRCTATRVNIPFFHQDENLTIRKLMRIRREHIYARDEFPIARLRDEFEVKSVRGPRGVPAELSAELKRAAGV